MAKFKERCLEFFKRSETKEAIVAMSLPAVSAIGMQAICGTGESVGSSGVVGFLTGGAAAALIVRALRSQEGERQVNEMMDHVEAALIEGRLYDMTRAEIDADMEFSLNLLLAPEQGIDL